MTKLYRVEITVAATAYVKATSKADALRKADKLEGQALTIEVASSDSPEVSALRYDNPILPPISLSPAMTIMGVEEDRRAEVVL